MENDIHAPPPPGTTAADDSTAEPVLIGGVVTVDDPDGAIEGDVTVVQEVDTSVLGETGGAGCKLESLSEILFGSGGGDGCVAGCCEDQKCVCEGASRGPKCEYQLRCSAEASSPSSSAPAAAPEAGASASPSAAPTTAGPTVAGLTPSPTSAPSSAVGVRTMCEVGA